jgi:hypothetical protein
MYVKSDIPRSFYLGMVGILAVMGIITYHDFAHSLGSKAKLFPGAVCRFSPQTAFTCFRKYVAP